MSAGRKAAVAVQVLRLRPVWRGGGTRRACGAAASLGQAGCASQRLSGPRCRVLRVALGRSKPGWAWPCRGLAAAATGSQLAR